MFYISVGGSNSSSATMNVMPFVYLFLAIKSNSVILSPFMLHLGFIMFVLASEGSEAIDDPFYAKSSICYIMSLVISMRPLDIA